MDTNSVNFFRKRAYKTRSDVERPIIIAWKIVNPENCGHLIRLADTIGCRKLLFVCDELQLSQRKVRRIAGESYKVVEFEYVREDKVMEYIPDNYELLALETAEHAHNLYQTNLPDNMAVVVGSERNGIDAGFLAKCKSAVYIPLTGQCTSLNVSHAAAVVLFEWLRQKIAL